MWSGDKVSSESSGGCATGVSQSKDRFKMELSKDFKLFVF